MLKKAIACLLVLAGVCSFHTSAADSKNEQFVNVNVFNKVSVSYTHLTLPTIA